MSDDNSPDPYTSSITTTTHNNLPPLSHSPVPSSKRPTSQQRSHDPRYYQHREQYRHYYSRPHHGLPTRPQSAVICGSQHHSPPLRTTGRPSSLASQPYALPPHQHPHHYHGHDRHSYGRSPPTNPNSPPESLSAEDEKLHHYDLESERGTAFRGPTLAEIQGASHHVPTSYYAASDTSSESDHTPTPRQTCRSLLHVALTAFPLSIGICLYTIFGLLFAALMAPLRLRLKQHPSFSTQLLYFLVPPLNLQRKFIYQPPLLTAPASSRKTVSSVESARAIASPPAGCSPTSLVATHILSPFVALPLAICAWVMGTAWGLGAMVSDEEAGDDRDERRFAERVVSWWASWLNRGLHDGDVGASRTGRGRRREMTQQRGRGLYV